jgi:hypothetical protein
MKKIIYYHIYNVFKFSYSGDYEKTFEKSKDTISSHFNNLIIVFIIFPLWILFDVNSLIREYIGTNKYEIRHFLIPIILVIVLLSFTKVNFIKKWLNQNYTTSVVDESVVMFENSPKFINYLYRFFFVFLNFFWVIIMFFVELKIFQIFD